MTTRPDVFVVAVPMVTQASQPQDHRRPYGAPPTRRGPLGQVNEGDRLGCYMARSFENVVAAGLADVPGAAATRVRGRTCLSGVFGTGKVGDERLSEIVRGHLSDDQGNLERSTLRRPIYKKTAAFGHSADRAGVPGSGPTGRRDAQGWRACDATRRRH